MIAVNHGHSGGLFLRRLLVSHRKWAFDNLLGLGSSVMFLGVCRGGLVYHPISFDLIVEIARGCCVIRVVVLGQHVENA